MDFAKRAHDHSYHIDPIVRSLLDTDFYKPLMHQFIWSRHLHTQVTFKVTNRTKDVPLADIIDMGELREQLDHVKSLTYTKSELINLKGQSYYGQDGIFRPGYIDFLRTFRMGDYDIVRERAYNGGVGYDTGQFDIRFADKWTHSSPWELHALTVVNELRNRALMKTMSKSELDITYARAKVKLFAKLKALADDPTLEGISISDFGTRRRHSFLWQEWVVQMMAEVLGDRFGGTSNVYLAMKHGFEARGTNAHELPMVYAALAKTDAELAEAPYELCREWAQDVRGPLQIMLPDTFGTTGFLKNAPRELADWAGARPDSKKAAPAIEELIAYWEYHNKDPKTKLVIPSDGLDVFVPGYKLQGEDIPTIYREFKGRVRMSFGWGTLATNDFVGCHPHSENYMKPISLVCKVESAEGHPAVKLSDVKSKSTGPKEEIERYRSVFGTDGVIDGQTPNV